MLVSSVDMASCSHITGNNSIGHSKTKGSRVVAFDLDETTGSWGAGSLIFQVCLEYGRKAPPTAIFVQLYLHCGGARPWLKPLLKELEKWKQIDRIDEVAIFTSASNSNGWVTFLKECMEEYTETPGLFGTCIARENSPLAAPENGGVRTVKDLSLLSPDAERVVLIDDKPAYALNGYVIAVEEYTQDVCITGLVEWMKTAMPTHAGQIDSVFAIDELKYPPNGKDFSGDDALEQALEKLKSIFPEGSLQVEDELKNLPDEETAPTKTDVEDDRQKYLEITFPECIRKDEDVEIYLDLDHELELIERAPKRARF